MNMETIHGKCRHTLTIPPGRISQLRSGVFSDEHSLFHWNVVLTKPHLYLHLVYATNGKLETQYTLNLEPRWIARHLDKSHFESKLVFPAHGFFEYHRDGEAVFLHDCDSNQFLYRQVIVYDFENYMKHLKDTGKTKGLSFTFSIDISALCTRARVRTLPIQQSKINLSKLSSNKKHSQISHLPTLLGSMMKDSDFCDIVIKVGVSQFKIHRSVLAAVSPVFRAHLRNNVTETQTCCIEIKDFETEVVQMMIDFIYTDRIESLNFTKCVELLKLSDMYDIKPLKKSCQVYLVDHITRDNVTQVLLLAEMTNIPELKKAALDYFTKHPKNYKPEEFDEILRARPNLLPVLVSKLMNVLTGESDTSESELSDSSETTSSETICVPNITISVFEGESF